MVGTGYLQNQHNGWRTVRQKTSSPLLFLVPLWLSVLLFWHSFYQSWSQLSLAPVFVAFFQVVRWIHCPQKCCIPIVNYGQQRQSNEVNARSEFYTSCSLYRGNVRSLSHFNAESWELFCSKKFGVVDTEKSWQINYLMFLLSLCKSCSQTVISWNLLFTIIHCILFWQIFLTLFWSWTVFHE